MQHKRVPEGAVAGEFLVKVAKSDSFLGGSYNFLRSAGCWWLNFFKFNINWVWEHDAD